MPYYGRFGYVGMIWFLITKMSLRCSYFPLYVLAPYVVYATTSELPTIIQGGLYAVRAGGYGGFCPTWVAA